jgi:hypothetical protein
LNDSAIKSACAAALCVIYRILHLFPSGRLSLFTLLQLQPVEWREVLLRALLSSLLFGAATFLFRRIAAKGTIRKDVALATLATSAVGFVSAYHLLHADVMGWRELLLRALVSTLLLGAIGGIHLYAKYATDLSTARRIGLSLAYSGLQLATYFAVFSFLFRVKTVVILDMLPFMALTCGIIALGFIALCVWFVTAEKVSSLYE